MAVKWIVTTSLYVQMMFCHLHNSDDGVTIEYSVTSGNVCWSEEGRFAFLFGLSIGQCVQECGLRKHCKALNFHSRLNVCELFSSDSGSDLHHRECIHVLSEDIEVIKTPCNDCVYGKVCDTTTKQCVYKECVSLDPLNHGRILGNMRNVGSKIRFICDYGYILRNGTSDAECTASGSWTATEECVNVHDDCYNDGQSHLYVGTRKTTITGRYCQRWDSQSPHNHNRTNSDTFPSGDLSANENYCRDPDNEGQPWCYTTDTSVRWEICGIRLC